MLFLDPSRFTEIEFQTLFVAVFAFLILYRFLCSVGPYLFRFNALPPSTYKSPAPGIGVCCVQGRRQYMEDTFRVETCLMGSCSNAYFAVYDGHGGDKASRFLESALHQRIVDDVELLTGNPHLAIANAFANCEGELLKASSASGWLDGSTANTCLVLNSTLYVANVGDSRAVLCSNGTALQLTVDHKPNDESEKERITSAGGKVLHLGVWRVEGVLALSRAFGDRHLKKYVTADPDISERTIDENDEFIILASDGIWDVLSNQNAVDIVRATDYKKDARASAKTLVETAFRRGSQDNMTCIIVDLQRYRGLAQQSIVVSPLSSL